MALEKITGIVTDIVHHSDRHNIISLYTRSHGRIAFLSAAGSTRSARLRNAALMPLSVISADINIHANRELQKLGQFSRPILWKDIYFNPVKSSLAIFLSEFINAYTRQAGPDHELWDFILHAIRTLDDAQRGLANFHLAFLMEFSTYSGIRPDISDWRPGSWLDLRGGSISILPPTHSDRLNPDQTALMPLLSRMNLRTAPLFRFNAEQRRMLLRHMLKYYALHFPGIGSLKSPDVLSEVFS